MYTSASSAHSRSWGKRRVRRGIRDWSAGAAGRRSANLACESWRGSLERRDAARLRPVQGRTTERLHSAELAIILLFFFSRSRSSISRQTYILPYSEMVGFPLYAASERA